MLVTSSLVAFVFKEEISGKNEPSKKKFNLKKCFLVVKLQVLCLELDFLGGVRAFVF